MTTPVETVALTPDAVLDERVARRRFAHQPALDGVRGLSVLLVLLYHGGWSWMGGGYVGVSVFFTLSGFLITRLLLQEHAAQGAIDMRRFWGRRMRRLLPASVLCLVAVSLLVAGGAFGSVPGYGADLTGSVLQLANWFQLAGDASYSEQVLGLQSPLAHYWSLAIEEQFYWLWPLAMLAVLRTRRPDRTLLLAAGLAGAAAPLIAKVWGADAAYWATPARAGEILIGAALAAVLWHHQRRPAPWVVVLGVAGLAVIVWAALRWPSASGPAYSGWFPVLAVASAGLIAGLQVRSPLRRGLSWRPLVAVGAVSYGVYLYHWPVFLLVERHVGASHLVRFLVACAITFVVAAVSYRLIEHPIRRGTGHTAALTTVGAVSVVGLLAFASIGSPGGTDRFANPEQAVAQLQPVSSLPALVARDVPPTIVPEATAPQTTLVPSTLAATEPAAAAPAPAAVPDVALTVMPSRPVRILVVGDSTAWSLGDGLAAWADANPGVANVTLAVSPGCTLIRGGFVTSDPEVPFAQQCNALLDQQVPEALVSLQPDVVMLLMARSDMLDRIWSPEEGSLPSTHPRFQEYQRADYRAFVDAVMTGSTARLAWVQPIINRIDAVPDDESTDPARFSALRSMIFDTVANSDPTRVSTIDLSEWYVTSGIDDTVARPDGIHLELPAATEVAARLIGPTLVNLALS